MSSPNEANADDPLHAACALIGAAPSAEGLDDAEIQTVLAGAVRLYAERAAAHEEPLPAFSAEAAGVTATDAMLTVTAILKAVNVATFELGIWQAWTRG